MVAAYRVKMAAEGLDMLMAKKRKNDSDSEVKMLENRVRRL
jgi:hypothetical protein